MNAELSIDAAEAQSESPALLEKRAGVAVTSYVGAEERPAFLDQARWLAEAWGATHRIAPGCHHFDVIDALEDKDSALMRGLIG